MRKAMIFSRLIIKFLKISHYLSWIATSYIETRTLFSFEKKIAIYKFQTNYYEFYEEKKLLLVIV